ncbi:hypothetical protein LEP1GSC045_1169 [Leptospira interrogans serovar Pomona str. Kennewicki LC82-25]|nr:hypothetical protein LEP1GSC045_1169 [Leptospira interrogans serovar Pomona str. Kennewicki LC82-25]EKN97525.1 hypothetical protein LEP1GSC014_4246 [Leptospira interrogans serovar Pomona str. Pomona]EKR25352.1 hypothetical protein LEP1GSC087_0758 [Leptospira interrogans serovar Bataviae str. L1111]EMF35271.1 hypothetical protein LEP1GSC201_1648 [Leptospira interrogans serovar Pomona str. Fox 32256]EMI71512.1 hypothetical protein LEP1GSC200_0533 [Leptospira interrogans serovar Pomona str. CSL
MHKIHREELAEFPGEIQQHKLDSPKFSYVELTLKYKEPNLHQL